MSCCTNSNPSSENSKTTFWDKLSSIPALIVSVIALAASLYLTHASAINSSSTTSFWQIFLDPAWITIVICGFPLFRAATTSLFRDHQIKASLLISSAMIACIAIGQLFAAGEVAFIMAIGDKLEDITLLRARRGLHNLISLIPKTVHQVITCPKCRAKGIFQKDVPPETINPNDLIEVRPGERIPLDGIIKTGETTVDQSTITGESLPIEKHVGDTVYSGTLNQFGVITLCVTKTSSDSSLQQLVHLVNEASKRKAPIQRIADKAAAILVPCALALAILTFLGLWLGFGDIHEALRRGVTILVVFCPCSLALATPTAIVAAIGQATRYGVIIKSGEALERMGRVQIACFDKTGTLTTGNLKVTNYTNIQTLALASAVECHSEHPLAKAITTATKTNNSTPINTISPATNFTQKPGYGTQGIVANHTITCGTLNWLNQFNVNLNAPEAQTLQQQAEALRETGHAIVWVAQDQTLQGFIALADTLRPNATKIIQHLAQVKLDSCLLTGDHTSTAQAIAKQAGLSQVYAELLPTDKADQIETFQKSGKSCCMIGDGVNDALALKVANVGIALAKTGSDLAVDAADIALIGDDLNKITYLKRLASACTRRIKFNITLSMCINAIAMVCSILGILGPISGALVHNAGSVLIVLNAALLYDKKFTEE